MDKPKDVTCLLRRIRLGDKDATEEAYRLLYGPLHQIAAIHMRRERDGHILQPTALVSEACLRLLRQHGKQWESRTHFLAVASLVMRRILIDYFRNADPPSGELDPNHPVPPSRRLEFLDLDRALDKLAGVNPRCAFVVQMRFFGGMGESEIATALEINVRSVVRDWTFARAFLAAELDPGSGNAPATSVRKPPLAPVSGTGHAVP
ncbi:MAG: ECF-type sigma factor [Bryobacteraceae bacterium]